MTIASLIVAVDAQTATIDRQAKQINQTLDSVASKADVAGEAIGAIGRYMAGAFTIGAIIGLAKEITGFASDTVDMANQVGIGVERVQALNYAMSGAGVTVDDMATGIAQLSKRLVGGDDAAAGALAKLGLSAQKLINMSPDEAFLDIVDAVSRIPNPMQQSALMMELFGRSGTRYLRLVHEDLRDLAEEAERNGSVIKRELIERADSLDDAWHRLVIRGKALVADVMIPMMDIMNGRANSDYSVFGRLDRFLGSGAADSLKAIQKTLAAPEFAPLRALTPLTMSMHEADTIARDLTEKIRENQRALEEKNRREVQLIKATMAANNEYFAMVDKVERDMLEIRRDREDKFYKEQERIAQEAGKHILEDTLALNNSLISLDAERMRNLLAVNQPGVVIAAKQSGISFGQNMLEGIQAGFSGLGNAILGALQGGGNVLKSIGGSFGLSFTQHMFGSDAFKGSMTKAFGGALGGMFNSLLPGIGALAGPLLSKIADLFGGIFGGPDKKEKAGRSATDAFTAELAASLDWMQKIELHQAVAQGASEKWATQVIAIRDAYLKAGRSADEAMAIVDRLWRAEKQGGNAVQLVIDEIVRTMHDTLPAAAEATAAAATAAFDSVGQGAAAAAESVVGISEAAAVAYRALLSLRGFNGGSPGEGTSEGKNTSDILSGLSEADAKNAYLSTIANTGSTSQDWDRVKSQYGFAGGTGGAYPDFGAGTLVTLHRRERVMTESEGRAEDAIIDELRALRAELRTLPTMMKAAMQKAAA